jgi:hypothetical protein
MSRTGLLLVLLLAPAAVAQTYQDSFSYSEGTVVPGWTERRGDWIIAAGRLHLGTTAGSYNYITKDGFSLKHSVTEALVFYDGLVSTVQAAGLCARHTGTSMDTGTVMCAIQDNTGGGPSVGFDSIWLYEQGGTGANQLTSLPLFGSCRARLLVSNASAVVEVDTDMNGTWDRRVTTTANVIQAAGGNGCSSGFLAPAPRCSGIDDFALFDAVLTSTGTAQPGSTLVLNLQGNLPGAPYQAAAAFANAPGIAVDVRTIPLAPDTLTILSLTLPSVFQAFSGVTDNNGSATARIVFPPVPQLAGIVFYTAFVTLSPAAPSGIANISNDHRIDIVP